MRILSSFFTASWIKWIALSFLLLGFMSHIFTKLSHYSYTETQTINQLQIETVESFRKGQMPTWNPAIGPGGNSAIFLGINPWEYKSFIYYLFRDLRVTLWIEFLLIYGAFLLLARMTTSVNHWAITSSAFLIFYNLDLMPWYSHHFAHSSTFVAFPIILGIFYLLETSWESLSLNKKKGSIALLFLSYVFSLQGTQIVVWILQFHVMLGVSLLLIRLFSGRLFSGNSFFVRPTNRVYLLVFGLGLTCHAWALYWSIGNVLESGRSKIHYGKTFFETLAELAQSFHLSSNFTFVCIYYGLLSFVLIFHFIKTKHYWRTLLIGLPLIPALIQILTTSWSWVPTDTLLSRMPPIQTVFVIGCFLGVVIHACLRSDRRGLLWFEIPVFFLVVHHFLFDNAHGDSFGARPIEELPGFFLPLVVVLTTASLYSSNRRLRLICIGGLLSLFLLRCHLTLPLMRTLGTVWHSRRDTIYWGSFVSLLALLGLEVFFLTIKSRLNNSLARGAAIGLLALLFLPLQKSTFRGYPWWGPHGNTEPHRAFVRAIFEEIGIIDSMKRIIFTTGKGRVSGFHMDLGISSVNLYESLIPKSLSQYYEPLYRDRLIKENLRCNLPDLWFPQNVLRVLQCSFDQRVPFYNAQIGNRDFRLDDALTFQKLGASYLVTETELKTSFLEPQPTERARQKVERIFGPIHQNLLVYQAKNISFNPFELDFKNQDCTGEFEGSALQVQSNIYAKPLMKRSINVETDLEAPACIRVPISFSRLWRVEVDKRTVQPGLVQSIYMGIPVGAGKHQIQLTYLPWLPALLLLGLGALTGGLIWIFKGDWS